MTFYQAIFLATLQGITEFLPVSSSGHLVLFQKIFKITQPPVFFDVLLHLGTLMAIVFFLGKEIILLLKQWRERKKEWLFVILGSIPAALFGFILNSKIEIIFDSLKLVGIMWISFGLFLLSTRLLINPLSSVKKISAMKWMDAAIVGLFQALALIPGISRSGSTIIGGLFRKLSKEEAFNFSFLLSIPAVLGAMILKIKDSDFNGVGIGLGVVSVTVAALVGLIFLKFLEKVLKSNKLYLFGIYCLILGLGVYFYL